MTETLDARVQRLEDLLEIHQLFVDYGLALDAGDFDTYASLFAKDGEVMIGPMGRAKGREEIRALMSGMLSGGVGSSFHIISSPQVQLDGDAATSQVMWSVVNLGDDGQARLTMLGRHRDDLVREDGRWRFARRRGFVDVPRALPIARAPPTDASRAAAMTDPSPFGVLAETPLTVVVVHRRRPDAAIRTVHALQRQCDHLRVVIVDNASPAEDRGQLATLDDVEIVELEENIGFGPAANVGLRRWLADGEGAWCLVCPHDATVEPGCLDLLVSAIVSQPPRAWPAPNTPRSGSTASRVTT